MDSKRTYLDSLNAGRQRRPNTTLEQLNRSLETLGQRLDRRDDGYYDDRPQRQPTYQDQGQRRRPPEPDFSADTIQRDVGRIREQQESVTTANRIASELKNLRDELQTQMSAGLRREFDGMRKDLSRAYAAAPRDSGELGVEFARLSDAIRSLSEKSDDRSVNLLRLELEQVRAAIDTLAREETVLSAERRWDEFDRRWSDFEHRVDARQKAEDPAIAQLTARLEQINQAVSKLPESLSLKSLEDKVRTLAGAVDRVGSQRDDAAPEFFSTVEQRLDEISRAIVASTVAAQSPQFDPEPINRIESRISALARQIEDIADDRPTAQIIERLNQLSLRIDDVARRAELPEIAVQRLGQQIGLIAQRLDADRGLPADDIVRGIEGRLDRLTSDLERRQDNASAHSQALFRELEDRLHDVAARLDQPVSPAVFDSSQLLDAIDARFSDFSRKLEDRKPEALGKDAIRGIEARLNEVATRLDKPAPAAPFDDARIIGAIEERFSDFSKRFDDRKPETLGKDAIRGIESRLNEVAARLDKPAVTPAFDNSRIIDAIDARFIDFSRRLDDRKPDTIGKDAIRGLEARLEDISSRIDLTPPAAPGVDPKLIRNLEAQVMELSAHLSRPADAFPELKTVGPRLADIEKSLSGTRDVVIEAARKAAEDAMRSFTGSKPDTEAVTGLAQDLKTLESLARRSDERNSKTFEAIHDTLLKIVDRLGTLEQPAEKSPAAAAPAPVKKVAVRNVPPIEPEAPSLGVAPAALIPMAVERGITGLRAESKPERTPAEAAAEAAVAALDSDEATPAEATSRVRSMLGGLTRAFSGRKSGEAAPVAAEAPAAVMERVAPKLDLDQPLDPKQANRPLEPGSGAPDLSAIMKRVRDERGQPSKTTDGDAAKSDFIAAARRAAQAAAAEAEVLKRHSDIAGPARGLKLGELLRARRKPILMAAAAVMIALAGLQLGKAFFADAQPSKITSAQPAKAAKDEKAAKAASAKPADVAKNAKQADPNKSIAAAIPDMAPVGDKTSGVVEDGAGKQAAPVASKDKAAAAAKAPEAKTGAVEAKKAEEQTVAVKPEIEEPAATIAVPSDAGPTALREAAEAGDPKALFEIGARYSEGRGVKEDLKAAAVWYERAAEQGLAPAQYRIGNLYEKGQGVARDLAKAKTWYQLAAAQGNASAMHNLAVLFAMGADGTTDNDSAARWFSQAAELGVKDSQFNLGILAAKGVGMPQNLEESYKWFALVAKTGDRDAASKRDDVANSLRPEQLERARATTELWKAKPLDPVANSVDIPAAWGEGTEKTASVDMKKAVQTIQLILNKNGYDAGGADGVMGQKTKTAIIQFQKDNDMPANGEVNEKLVQVLLAKK